MGRMFRRRRRPLASPRPLAPPGGFAEFYEFEGRWFVTDGWATGSGVAVERPATGEYLPVRRYRPEKRLVILADQTGMRCHDARNSAARVAAAARRSARQQETSNMFLEFVVVFKAGVELPDRIPAAARGRDQRIRPPPARHSRAAPRDDLPR